jgi:hypothetical protein
MVSVVQLAGFTNNLREGWATRSTVSCPATGSTRRSSPKAIASEPRSFPPSVILSAFIGQVLDPDHSCRKALARIQVHLARMGGPTISTDTGGYCKARKRLPEGLFSRLARRVGAALSGRAGQDDLWCGRRLKVVDGTGCSMPDTPANQKEYPQPSSQLRGCGFPALSLVGVFCLATGAALDIALGRENAHDLTLFRWLRRVFEPGDVMLADRGFCSYAEIALLWKQGVDTVMRLHQTRAASSGRPRVFRVKDRVETWKRPATCPKGLRKSDYRRLPKTLKVREVGYRVETPGFRTHTVTLATTLLDAERYSADALAELYFDRWTVELDFAYIKTTMQMDVLRGKTPAMVRKEIWTHLLAYNIIRSLMWEAAMEHGVDPTRVSFKGTLQRVTALSGVCASPRSQQATHIWTALLYGVAADLVPHRPDRIEPRVRKRRPKAYPLMTKPRAELKAQLRA